MAMDDEQAKSMTVRKAVTERWNPGQVWVSTASFGQGKGSGLGAFPSYGNMQRTLMAKVFSEDTRSEIGQMSASANMAELFYTSNGVPIDEDKSWPYADRYNFDIVKAGTFSGHFVGVNEITAKLNMEREPRFYGSLGFDRGYYELTTTTSNAGASFNMLKRVRGTWKWLCYGVYGSRNSSHSRRVPARASPRDPCTAVIIIGCRCYGWRICICFTARRSTK